MRHQAAPGTPRRMLHMQHLVKQNVLHRELRHAETVHAPVQQNVIRPRIVAAELPPPASVAPADVRALQFAVEVSGVKALEKFLQIKMPPLRPRRARTYAPPTHVIDALSRAVRPRVLQIWLR